MKRWMYIAWILLLMVAPGSRLMALNPESQKELKEQSEAPKKFDAGKFVMEHVMDAHEWHIMKIRETHISIPLPVILYTREKGLSVFFSSKFHHGTKAYKGYLIAQEGPHEGKIVQANSDGSINEEVPLPIDLSITKTVAAMLISMILILLVFIPLARKYVKNPGKAPSGFQSLIEPVILFVRDDIAIPSIGIHRYEKFMPYLLTAFFFILVNNLMGLVPIPPGGANVTGNIAITALLAIFSFLITTFSTNRHYWKHIFNAPGVPWWLKFPIPLMPFIELLGAFTKPLVLCIRLFANILAGHFIALSFIVMIFIFGQINWIAGYGSSIVSVLFYVFMTMLELLVAFIQAYVFTLLSAIYFGMAREESH
ncbi:MAG: ATP synthase F0 subunit A [Porphyromonadaceae bacterium]|nr:MAG: ATP synthase F0 subunit A [Porphyromonadaceae bacterium]